MTFTDLPDDSVLAGGLIPGQGIYDVSALTDVSGITGIRLETLKDPSLPRNGPGFAANGNFVITEIQLDAATVPEPSTVALFSITLVALRLTKRKSN